MRNSFRHLDFRARDRIEALLAAGHTQTEIAKILGIPKSTVSRELRQRKRQDGIYQASRAEQKAQVKRSRSKHQGMKIENHPWLRKHIISELGRSQSPDGIAGRMKEERWPVRVSADAIYRWLRSAYGQRYCRFLYPKRYSKKAQTNSPGRHIIPNLVSIHALPADSGWVAEGDPFLSPKKTSKTAAVLIGWREARLLKGDLVKSLRPAHMTQVMKKMNAEHVLAALVLDQGGENREHEQFGVPTFFCDPASPRQKPFIENSIGLCRRWWWPKGTDLRKVGREEFKDKIEILNNKYRKTLRYRSANEVAREYGILKGN